jgi:hypothetical protein
MGKSADETQSLCPMRGLNVRRLLGPGKRQRLSDVGRAVLLHKTNEIKQCFACCLQFET